MITKNVKLYLTGGYPVRVPVSQFDTMWQFVFEIIKDSTEWTIPTGATVTMNGRKPDGNVFAFSGAVSNNKVNVNADVQMTAVAGDTLCELSFLSSGKVVGTANFVLAVEAAPKSPDDISSDSTLPAYGEILDEISGITPRILPAGGSTGQVLAKNSGNNYDVHWVNQSGGGSSVEPYTSTPANLGTASAGSSAKYARGDHVHKMPSASDVGAYALPSGGIPATDLASSVQTSLGKADSALQSVPSTYRTAAAQDVIDAGKISAPSSPASGAFLVWNGSAWVAHQEMPKETVAGATPTITPADNTWYQCGTLTSLTVSSPPATGKYVIVFTSGATATTTTIPATILGLESFSAEANTVYEINVVDNRAVVGSWAVSA